MPEPREPREPDFFDLARQELARAREKFGPINGPHEGYAVLLEEVDELWDAVKRQRPQDAPAHFLMECVQIAAMAGRFAIDLALASYVDPRDERKDARTLLKLHERAALRSAPPGEQGWRPIESAPKDGRWVILANHEDVRPGFWGPTYFSYDPAWIVYSHRSDCEEVGIIPTHWQPLPPAPGAPGEPEQPREEDLGAGCTNTLEPCRWPECAPCEFDRQTVAEGIIEAAQYLEEEADQKLECDGPLLTENGRGFYCGQRRAAEWLRNLAEASQKARPTPAQPASLPQSGIEGYVFGNGERGFSFYPSDRSAIGTGPSRPAILILPSTGETP